MSDNMEDLAKNVENKQGKPAWREFIESLLVIILLALLIRSFIISPFKIPSSSMVPTLEVGDLLFVTRYAYGFRLPFTDVQWLASEAKRGDVVVFDYPEDRSKDYIKRVVGIAGDVIEYKDNMLYINGLKMNLSDNGVHTYLMGDNSTGVSGLYMEQLDDVQHQVLRQSYSIRDGKWTVPEGHYFMLGDNRNNSRDSRFWGFVPQEYLVGKAVVVRWSWKGVSSWSVRWDRLGTLIH
ncbi:MAG: signal peptidase I [Mariprofundaceae bacterium]|nr:signal peptidase I [Mariprofundaceae bacterium]